MRELRANTTATIKLGPFLDKTDGITAEAGEDIDAADVLLSKNGSALTLKNQAGDNAAYDAQGFYDVLIDATDTNTPGELLVTVNLAADATATPAWQRCMVISEFEWDRKHLNEGNVGGSLSGVLHWGTCQANTDVDVIKFESGHGIVAGHGGHCAAFIYSGAGEGETKLIQSIASDSGVPDGSWGTAPTTTSKYVVFPVPSSSVDNVPLVNADLFKKNTAFANFPFTMRLSTDHSSVATGRTVTATRSIDGGAYAACANSVVEISGGTYKILLAATDLNGDVISFLFAATGADTIAFGVKTQDV